MTQFITIKNDTVQDVQDASWMNHSKASSFLSDEEWWSSLTKDADNQYIIEDDGSYSVSEVTDEDVPARLLQLDNYIERSYMTGIIYNIAWTGAIGNAEEILDDGGNSYDPKQYVQSHFSGDDTAKTARILADEWTQIRAERTRLLAETDYLGNSDMTMNDAWKVYRAALRTLPADQSSKTTYASITWPTKP